ncbi:MAG: DUF234 domain-containing protein [Candidatus Gracilibacteria bacterium]|nr:DUF234 domain-containing protein [Candidatus Gracilibacteria bacterium]
MKNFEELKNFIKKDIDIFLGISFEELIKNIIITENIKNKLPFKNKKKSEVIMIKNDKIKLI